MNKCERCGKEFSQVYHYEGVHCRECLLERKRKECSLALKHIFKISDQEDEDSTKVRRINKMFKLLEKHYLLWDWLVNNPTKTEQEWPEWGITAPKYCNFLCKHFGQCDRCIYTFIYRHNCKEDHSIYNKWRYSSCPDTRRKYAIFIRDLCSPENLEKYRKIKEKLVEIVFDSLLYKR